MSQGQTIPPELDAQMTPEVRAFVRLLLGRTAQLEAEVADLKRRLAKAERGAHAAATPAASPAQSEAATSPPNSVAAEATRPKKKRGGQPGHPKHARSLIPTTECDEVHVLKPDACRRCGSRLAGSDKEPLRHQVFELPEIKLHLTEVQRHRLTCRCCGTQTCAELPAGTPTGQSGPRLVAFVALLMGMFRQSKRRVSLFCKALLNHDISPGLVVKHQRLASDAIAAAHDALVRQLPSQTAVCADETPTKQENRNAWIWTVVAKSFTVFRVRMTKAAHVIKDLLGEGFAGVATSDRAKTYHWIDRHQWCWAHLKRDFEKMSLRSGQAGMVGTDLLKCTQRLFHDWHRVRDGTLTRRGFHSLIVDLKRDVRTHLEEGSGCADQATRATCDELLRCFDNLWQFATNEDVEPTNNAAERSLRHAVIWKHLSLGTQSDHGSRFVERLLTVIETCHQQSRNPFAFLIDSLTAHLTTKPAPSLLDWV